jgi:hypothetical protein
MFASLARQLTRNPTPCFVPLCIGYDGMSQKDVERKTMSVPPSRILPTLGICRLKEVLPIPIQNLKPAMLLENVDGCMYDFTYHVRLDIRSLISSTECSSSHMLIFHFQESRSLE